MVVDSFVVRGVMARGEMSRGMKTGVRAGANMLTARRHVDYGRVRSAMCPAG